MLISSQRFLDDEKVAEKLSNKDFTVFVSPSFELDGVDMRVVMDGHHSYAAAKIAGVTPVFVEQTHHDNDRICLIEQDIDLFLESCFMDSDWYDLETGRNVF